MTHEEVIEMLFERLTPEERLANDLVVACMIDSVVAYKPRLKKNTITRRRTRAIERQCLKHAKHLRGESR